jgi:predicted RNA-binding protein Jag
MTAMDAYREFTGKSVEEALKNAREEFGVGLDDLDFEILTPGSRGVLGMGAEPARILAAPRALLGGAAPKRDAAASKPLPPPPPRERDDDRRGFGRERGGGGFGDRDRGPRRDDRAAERGGPGFDRGADRDRGFDRGGERSPRPDNRGVADRSEARPLEPETESVVSRSPEAQSPERASGDRPAVSESEREGGRGRFGGRDRGPRREDRGPRRDDRGPRPDRPRFEDRGPRREGREGPAREGRGVVGLSETEEAEVSAARGSVAAERAELEAAEASPEALAAGKVILEKLLDHMGFDVKVDVESGETSRLNVIGEGDEREALGALIGRKGERLSALQHLVNLMLSREMGAWTRVLVDVEDYRGRRERQLREIAERAAARVLETGKMLQLEPMPALERRWVHLALRNNPDVVTQSIGEEPNRRIVVLPQNG